MVRAGMIGVSAAVSTLLAVCGVAVTALPSGAGPARSGVGAGGHSRATAPPGATRSGADPNGPGGGSRGPASPARPATAPPSPTPSTPHTASLRPDGPLQVVALGDSVTAGTACGCTPFAEIFGRAVAARTGRVVHVSNAGVPGLDSAGLAQQLAGGPVAQTVAASDIVTVTIGANDFGFRGCTWGQRLTACYAATVARMRANLGQEITRIKALRGGRATTILVTGYWNIWKDGAVGRALGAGYARVSDSLTRTANAAIASVASAAGAQYVDLYAPFKGDGDRDDTALLAADGDHPDAAGHRVIANALFAAENWVVDPAEAPA